MSIDASIRFLPSNLRSW